MRVVIQRVSEASVTVDNIEICFIKSGLLIFVGIEDADSMEDIEWLSKKIINLRIFNDDSGTPNISVKEMGGDIILVSQFTLHASTRKGNRPSYIKASKPVIAVPLYESFILQLTEDLGKKIHTGQFGADMKIKLINDGPITIWIDSRCKE